MVDDNKENESNNCQPQADAKCERIGVLLRDCQEARSKKVVGMVGVLFRSDITLIQVKADQGQTKR
jgi:hypothetical protein